MQLNRFLTGTTIVVLLLLSAVGAAAQVTPISGKVALKRADGTVVPVSGAVIDIYRTDIKWAAQVKTAKNGEYTHAGLPFVGTYTIAASAPGAHPDYVPNVRVSQRPVIDFELQPGDGSRLTLEQIKQLAAAAPRAPGASAAESAETKAARERLERETARIAEENKRITAANEIVARTFKAGNEAINAGRYDEAIAQYREGLAARPDEPAILTNLAEALRQRGVNRFNAGVKLEGDRKEAGIEAAKKDWSEAAQASRKALDIIKSAPTDDPDLQRVYAQNRLAALSAYALAMRLVATKVDQTQANAAWEAYQEYIGVQTDPAKKTKLRGEALQMVFDSGSIDVAIAEARKILATEPNQVDANRVLGLALFASGEKKNFQDAADHLQRYVALAPDTDPLKQSAKESLDYLKTAENIEPRRGQATPRPVPRPVQRRP